MKSSQPPEKSGLEFCCTLRPGPEMIDYNNHLNIGCYGVLFEDAARVIFAQYDLSRKYRLRTNHALFAVEMHCSFEREVLAGQPVGVYFHLLGVTDKKIHALFLMFLRDDQRPAAIQELLYLHVDLAARKVAPMQRGTQAVFDGLRARHSAFRWEPACGLKIGSSRSSAKTAHSGGP